MLNTGTLKPINYKWIYVIYIVVFSLVTLHKLLVNNNAFNNFEIFRYSFHHLLSNQNLYESDPDHYFDLFKYNPSFALFMAPFWYLPPAIGIFIWNLTNALLPVYAINKLPIKQASKIFFSFFILIEMITSVQNAQSNGLMLGLMMLTLVHLENKQVFKASLTMMLGFFIKIFSLAVGVLLLFYTKKKYFILFSTILLLVIMLLPLFLIKPEYLVNQYINWFQLLSNDPSHELNYSIMSFVERSLLLQLPQVFYLIAGLLVLLLPLVRTRMYSIFNWRLTYLSAILVWVVIFNHKAESPTFVIAMAGSALWFIASRKTALRWSLLLVVFFFTGLSATDIFPEVMREQFIKPYAIKVLPCILLFIFMISDLLSFEYQDDGSIENTSIKNINL